jgi:hypothetical protein
MVLLVSPIIDDLLFPPFMLFMRPMIVGWYPPSDPESFFIKLGRCEGTYIGGRPSSFGISEGFLPGIGGLIYGD